MLDWEVNDRVPLVAACATLFLLVAGTTHTAARPPAQENQPAFMYQSTPLPNVADGNCPLQRHVETGGETTVGDCAAGTGDE